MKWPEKGYEGTNDKLLSVQREVLGWLGRCYNESVRREGENVVKCACKYIVIM